MKDEWTYNLRWRPNFEMYELGIWLTGICVTAVIMMAFSLPVIYGWITIGVQLLFAIQTAPAAIDIYRFKRRLARPPEVLKMKVSDVIDGMIKHPDCYLMGMGFDWGQEEGQMATEIIRRDIKPLLGKTSSDFMGLGWLHAIGGKNDWTVISENLLSLHTLMTGTTGSGKSTMFRLLILQAAIRRQPLILFDPKNDEALSDWMEYCMKIAGRSNAAHYVSLARPEKSSRMSPLASYTKAGEVAARITSVIQRESGASDPFISFGFMSLTTVIELMDLCDIKPTLKSIKSMLTTDISSLGALLQRAIVKFGDRLYGEKNFTDIFEAYLEQYLQKNKKKRSPETELSVCTELYMSSMRHEKSSPAIESGLDMYSHQREHFQKMILNIMPVLSQLTQGHLGNLLSPDVDDNSDLRSIIDLRSVITTGGMLYIGLDSLSDAETGSAVGSIFLSDITSVAGDIYNYMKPRGEDLAPVMILIDEAAEIINDMVIKILNKGRGAGLRMFISSQSTADFEARLGSEAKMKQVIINCNHYTALRTPDPDSQEAVIKRIPLTKYKYIMRTHGSSVGSDPEMISGNVGERLMEEEGELFPAPLLGWLPNLEYMAINQARSVVKSKIPIITIPESEESEEEQKKEEELIAKKIRKFNEVYKNFQGEKSRLKH